MRNTTPQQYKARGTELGIDQPVLTNSLNTIERIKSVDARLFPLLTLNHLSMETEVSYGYLRKAIGRKINTYSHFYLKKRLPGRRNVRFINVPHTPLLKCQRWISDNILRYGVVHHSSYAYHPKSSPILAAKLHVNAHWLIKVDIHDFFHGISEHKVYRVFRSLGYARLLSLELARLCTLPCEKHPGHNVDPTRDERYKIKYYKTPYLGIVPQGAPTSPMLSNLVMREIDEALASLATKMNMRFSRYADDIVFSCTDARGKASVNKVKRRILQIINEGGFRPNLRKTVIRGPGTRKIVLGIMVDSKEPKLPKEYKDKIRLHLHYLVDPKFGPSSHANARKTSISKIYHHVLGLIYWARAVEPDFGNEALVKFNSINWPPISKTKYFD